MYRTTIQRSPTHINELYKLMNSYNLVIISDSFGFVAIVSVRVVIPCEPQVVVALNNGHSGIQTILCTYRYRLYTCKRMGTNPFILLSRQRNRLMVSGS